VTADNHSGARRLEIIVDAAAITEEIKKFHFWYHKIDLGNGVVTPGLDFDDLWNMIRKTRAHIEYAGKTVLDVASFDGMWAFEAERLGSAITVATDCYYETQKNFLFCHKVLNSKAVLYYNISPYTLWDRLDVFLQENWDKEKPYDRLFDVVQHLGLLYHLRDPLLSLSQARSVIRTGGYLLLETAAVINETASFMLFNGVPPAKPNIYDDLTTWWAPTVPCLNDMLRASLFEPIPETVRVLAQESIPQRLKAGLKQIVRGGPFTVSRVSLVAKAVAASDIDSEYYRELARTYRNPGLVVQYLGR